jgi:hypothetical protein
MLGESFGAAVNVTAIHPQVIEKMSLQIPDVPLMSYSGGNGPELIDSAQLAARWQVPESWIRNHTRARTPQDERIPCIRFGRYVRFEWGSRRLAEWLAKRQH